MRAMLKRRVEKPANHKRVRRFMRLMGLRGIAPAPKTTKTAYTDYSNLLKDFQVTKPNQVWCADISYIRIKGGFTYAVAIMDLYSHKVLSFGSVHDINGFYGLPLNLEEGAILYADKGYADYEIESLLKEVEKINLMPIRKKNSKRFDPFKQFIAKMIRKFIETIGSCLNGLFPKKIHTVTLHGFLLKLVLFVLGFNIQQLIKLIKNL